MTYDRINPFYSHLINIDWFIFGSLTWNDERSRACSHDATRQRLKDFNRLIRKACFPLGLKEDDIAFYFKSERGITHQGHAHFLIARQGIEHVPPILADTLNTIWAIEAKMGTADVQLLNPALKEQVVGYTCKREFAPTGQEYDTYDCASKALKSLIRAKQN
jgi:hypothetical protein